MTGNGGKNEKKGKKPVPPEPEKKDPGPGSRTDDKESNGQMSLEW